MPEIRETNVSNLRFTQEDISGVFKHGELADMSVREVADSLKKGKISASSLFPLVVHQIKDCVDWYWCENNRSLYALLEAGYSKDVPVIVKKNDFKSRYLKDAIKEMLMNDAFRPSIRGLSSAAKGVTSFSLKKCLIGASIGVVASFAVYKLIQYLMNSKEEEEEKEKEEHSLVFSRFFMYGNGMFLE
eukprot:TRINITY_DN3737_c0_g1_i1.p1 TRINITY_DN3737_c0_g1~~TRINITY_DN3737_c0_g1_i1.p1  ORF type:complete len:188 (-),score=29.76 TRINITY_DN3737_c0_g1_i1:107-670(-)